MTSTDTEALTIAAAAGVGGLIAAVRFLTASSRNVAADRLVEIKDLREQLKRVRGRLEDADDNIRQAEAQCKDRVHAGEVKWLEREKDLGAQIAALQAELAARPSTESIAGAMRDMNDGFASHRGELVALLDRVADGQTRMEGALNTNTKALELLVNRSQRTRRTDPGGTDPPNPG